MKDRAERVSRYRFTSQDKLFLDTNIWLYLYASYGPDNYWVEIYSDVFNRILNAKSQIYIDVLVVSEFINRFARQEWELDESETDSFKTFRKSLSFKPVAQAIAAIVKKIMSDCLQIESGFERLEIDGLLNDYVKGHSDFNDQVITELCKNNGLTLVTHDGDFDPVNLHILTENNFLLQKR